MTYCCLQGTFNIMATSSLLARLEWTNSHQCTSWGWARSTRFADEHPPCPSRLFFHLLSAPKFSTSTLLPTTYQAHPPSLHCQSSRDLEWLWSGSWSCGRGAGAGPAELERDPRAHKKVKCLRFFFVLFCFVWRRFEKSSSFFTAEEKEGDSSNVAITFFFFLFLCCTAA